MISATTRIRAMKRSAATVATLALLVAGTHAPASAQELDTLSDAEVVAHLGQSSHSHAALEVVSELADAARPLADALGSLVPATVEGESRYAADNSVLTELPEGENRSTTIASLQNGESVTFTVPGVDEFDIVDHVAVGSFLNADSDVVVHPTEGGGVQFMKVFREGGDLETFEIDIAVPEDHGWKIQPDGSLRLVADDEGTDSPLLVVDAPWALDATGESLPTFYRTVGTSIEQIIDTSEATFPVIADPSVWWWTTHIAGCLAELALLTAAGAKVVAAFAKAEKIIKASKSLAKAYDKLGKSMSKVIKSLVQYVKDKKKLTKAQAKAVEDLIRSAGTVFINLLGLGTCFSLVREMAS